MVKPASYYRARLKIIEELIKQEVELASNDERDLRILRNGVIPARLQPNFDQLISKYAKDQPDNDLSFDEITRFNTWFEIHPEKVAGTEVITSSRDFPIIIKGTEEDIIQTITPELRTMPDSKNKRDLRVRKAKAKSIARKRSLELMKI